HTTQRPQAHLRTSQLSDHLLDSIKTLPEPYFLTLEAYFSVALTTVIDCFIIPPPPSTQKHLDLDNNQSHNDDVLYGRFHLPTYRLDALFTNRFHLLFKHLLHLYWYHSHPLF
ncbi:hypothetical protein O181_070773, partial [Austropuccinia psidii MF-1]|nr:hypothetical protein [Austropuccinia psidii MF-1]